jgi:hypothetical protein
MTPEQREKKNAADKARRLRMKAETAAINQDVAKAFPGRAIEPGGLFAPTAPTTVAAVLTAKHAAEKAQAEDGMVPLSAVAAVKTTRPLRRSERVARRAKIEALKPPVEPKPKASGGKRAGAGAPVTTAVRMRVITFKGTQEHYDAFHAAGAGAWLRGVLDAGVALKHIKVPK